MAPLATPRYAFGAATAAGKIYVIGGIGIGASTLASTEIYSPLSHRWTAGPPLPEARAGLAAVTGADGMVYVIGGRSPPFGSPNPTVLRLDPAAGTWTPVAPLPTPRSYLAVALGVDGTIYAIGGDAGGLSPAVEAYSPATNTWTAASGLSAARFMAAAATAGDGRVYLIGGNDGSGPLTQVLVYTPGGDAWSVSAPLDVGRDALGAAALAGRLFIAGGENAGVTNGTLAQQYSAATNAWTGLPLLSVPRRLGATVAGPDGTLYAIGGLSSTNVPLGSVEAFRPALPMRARIDIQPGDSTHHVDLSVDTGYVRVGLLSGGDVDVQHAEGCALQFAGASALQLRSGSNGGERACDEHLPTRRDGGRGGDHRGDHARERIFRFPINALTLTPGATGACLSGPVDEGRDRGEFEGCGAVMTGGTPRAWSPIASMLSPHFLNPLVADNQGRAYAIGGWDATQNLTAAVERFDPASGQWTAVSPLLAPRTGLSAALGPDGRIYAASGYDSDSAVADAQVYDPSTDTWTALPPMAVPHAEAVGAIANGKFYVFGGVSWGDTVTIATVEAYDLTLHTWSAGVPLPAPRQDAAVVLAPSGEIYVMGGLAALTDSAPQATVWAFNAASGTWRTLANLPAPRYSACGAVDAKGTVYLIGGDNGSATVTTVFAYNAASNTWSQVASLGTAREGQGCATVADGRIVAAGGFDGALFTQSAEAYAKP